MSPQPQPCSPGSALITLTFPDSPQSAGANAQPPAPRELVVDRALLFQASPVLRGLVEDVAGGGGGDGCSRVPLTGEDPQLWAVALQLLQHEDTHLAGLSWVSGLPNCGYGRLGSYRAGIYGAGTCRHRRHTRSNGTWVFRSACTCCLAERKSHNPRTFLRPARLLVHHPCRCQYMTPQDNITGVCRLAHKFGMCVVQKSCLLFLTSNLPDTRFSAPITSPKNVLHAASLAERYLCCGGGDGGLLRPFNIAVDAAVRAALPKAVMLTYKDFNGMTGSDHFHKWQRASTRLLDALMALTNQREYMSVVAPGVQVGGSLCVWEYASTPEPVTWVQVQQRFAWARSCGAGEGTGGDVHGIWTTSPAAATLGSITHPPAPMPSLDHFCLLPCSAEPGCPFAAGRHAGANLRHVYMRCQ